MPAAITLSWAAWKDKHTGQTGVAEGNVAFVVNECWVVQKLPAAPSQMEQHKEPLIKCHCTNTPNLTHTCTHKVRLPQITELHPYTFRAPQCTFWFVFMESSHSLVTMFNPVSLWKWVQSILRRWVGGPFSWWELSNVIKIHAQLTGKRKCQ